MSAQMDFTSRHFTDIFGGFSISNDRKTSHHADNKLKRKPKCVTRNKCTNESYAEVFDNSCNRNLLFAVPKSAVNTPSIHFRQRTVFIDMHCSEMLELGDTQTAGFAQRKRLKSSPVFYILCEILECSDNVTSHQAAALLRWLSRQQCHQMLQTASASLIQSLLASKSPLVSFICCHLLKQIHLMHTVTSGILMPVDVISQVLFVQKELVKFLETGHFSVNVLNVICLLDCIAATCSDVLAQCNRLYVSSQFFSDWSSAELRWALLSVILLTNVITAKVKLKSAKSLSDCATCISLQVARVPQIFNKILTTSLQCEIAQAGNVYRILNEYWYTTNFCQRRLIVESVLLPKLRMELCIMILARHCDVLLRGCFAKSLLLDDILSIFPANVLITAIKQHLWMEDSSSLAISHCQEICVVLCNAISSYILHQKEIRGHLLDDDIMALQQLPDYAAAVKKRLSEISQSGHIMDIISLSALDRIACLADSYYIDCSSQF